MLIRARSVLLTAVVIGLGVVVGLLGVGGTWALWSAAAPANAGVVQTADFRVELNGTSMTTVQGSAATITVPVEGRLTPTTPVYATVTVANVTNAGAPFTVTTALGAPTVSSVSVPELARILTVRTAVAPASGNCGAAQYSHTSAVDVPKGTTARFCVRISLPSEAPRSVQNATATIVLPITATQKGH